MSTQRNERNRMNAPRKISGTTPRGATPKRVAPVPTEPVEASWPWVVWLGLAVVVVLVGAAILIIARGSPNGSTERPELVAKSDNVVRSATEVAVPEADAGVAAPTADNAMTDVQQSSLIDDDG